MDRLWHVWDFRELLFFVVWGFVVGVVVELDVSKCWGVGVLFGGVGLGVLYLRLLVITCFLLGFGRSCRLFRVSLFSLWGVFAGVVLLLLVGLVFCLLFVFMISV